MKKPNAGHISSALKLWRGKVLTKITARVDSETDLSYEVIWCGCCFGSAERAGFVRAANIELVIVLGVRGKFLSFNLPKLSAHDSMEQSYTVYLECIINIRAGVCSAGIDYTRQGLICSDLEIEADWRSGRRGMFVGVILDRYGIEQWHVSGHSGVIVDIVCHRGASCP